MKKRKVTKLARKKIGEGNRRAWSQRKQRLVRILAGGSGNWSKLTKRESRLAVKAMIENADGYFFRLGEDKYTRKQCRDLGLAHIKVAGHYRVILPLAQH